MRVPRRALVVAALAASVPLAVAGCGGGSSSGGDSTGSTTAGTTTGGTTTSAATGGVVAFADGKPMLPDLPEPTLDDTNRFPRPSTVGDGLGGPPAIDPDVKKAATAAGCTVASFKSEGRNHVAPDKAPVYGQQPPTSGNHFQVPAKWGVYDRALPDMLAVHNLEHGGNIVYVGTDVPADARTALGKMWAQSPPFVVIAPGVSKGFPSAGVVVTSWQRWLVCKPFTVKQMAAVEAFRDAYRGTGPEGAAALHAPGSVPFPDAPEPLKQDPGAEQG